MAYSELYFEHTPPSMWQARNADINATPAIEFHSLSKTFNMTGYASALPSGTPTSSPRSRASRPMSISGVFNAIQAAGAVALDHFDHADVKKMRSYRRQRAM